MPELRLPRIPDRTPVRIAIAVMPDLNQALNDYAEAYRAAYGQAESVADLIPYLPRSFLESDRGFARASEIMRPEDRHEAAADRFAERSHPEPLSVRISAAVALTGISRSRLYELIQSGDLDTVKTGRTR